MTPPAAAAPVGHDPAYASADSSFDPSLENASSDPPGWPLPGALVVKLVAVALLAVLLAGSTAAWLVSYAST